jgi:hypothetical protein
VGVGVGAICSDHDCLLTTVILRVAVGVSAITAWTSSYMLDHDCLPTAVILGVGEGWA